MLNFLAGKGYKVSKEEAQRSKETVKFWGGHHFKGTMQPSPIEDNSNMSTCSTEISWAATRILGNGWVLPHLDP